MRLLIVWLLLAWAGCGGRFSPRAPVASEPPGGGGGGGSSPDDEVGSKPAFAGLDSALAGDGFVTLRWTPVKDSDGEPDTAVTYLVYVAETADALDFTQPRLETRPGKSFARVKDLVNGTVQYFVVRAHASDPGRAADENLDVIPAVPAPVVYVDASRFGLPGDGTTPETAFGTIGDGFKAAQGLGGGNVWVREGNYQETLSDTQSLPAGVSLFGGFDASFDALTRDRDAHPTRVYSAAGKRTALDLSFGTQLRVIDGLILAGLNPDSTPTADQGFQARASPFCLANVLISQFRSNGMHLPMTTGTTEVFVVRSEISDTSGNGSKGIDVGGSVRMTVSRSRVLRNQNDGLGVKDFTAEPDGESSLVLRRSSFVANGDKGVNVHFNEIDPSVGRTSVGATERVILESCFVARNHSNGVKLEIAFDADDEILAQGWIRGCTIRENGSSGVLLYSNFPSDFLIESSTFSANGHSGLHQSGSSMNVVVPVINSAILGNAESGLVSTVGAGLVSVFCCIAGNKLAGLESDAGPGLLLSSVALQNAPDLVNARAFYSLIEDGEAEEGGISGDPGFAVFPSLLTFPKGDGGNDFFKASKPSRFKPGDAIEIADDNASRRVTDVSADSVTFEPAFGETVTVLTPVFLQDESKCSEDFTLDPASPLIDAGFPLEQDLDGTRADAGPFGGPGATAPGTLSGAPAPVHDLAFFASSVFPAMGSTSTFSEIRAHFTRKVAKQTVDASTFRVTRDGKPVSGSLTIVDQDVVFTPDSGVSRGTYRVGIGPGIGAKDGHRLSVAFEYEVQAP